MSFGGGFGNTFGTGGGGFGGGFGQQTQQPAQPASTFGFGQNTAQNTAFTFGGTAAPQTTGFGAPTTTAPATGFGGFGTQPQAAAPATGFGATGFGTGTTGTTGGFGASTTTGFGATTGAFGAQVAQQPAATNTFGFGTNTTGSTGMFGQTAAPSTGFGAATTGGGFGTGGFGQPATTAPSTTSNFSFGSTAPAATTQTGFGFGTQPAATTGFGTTGATGFGATPAATTGFGAPAATGFGAIGTAGALPTGPATMPPAVQQWQYVDPVKEQSNASAAGTAAQLLHFHNISKMAGFHSFSVEELRWQFIKEGNPPQPAGMPSMQTGFGTAAPGFGATAQPAAGGFGSFGTTQPAQQSTFGFGTTTGGGFGTAAPAAQTGTTGFGGFGQTGQTGAATTGGGFGFGTGTAGGGFGTQPSTTTTGFGTGLGGFGTTNTQQQTGTTGFGTTGTTGNAFAFGQTGAQTQQPATGGFGFGTAAPQQGTSTSGGAFSFGQPAATGQSTGFSFGQTQPAGQTGQTQTSGFSFGQPAAGTQQQPQQQTSTFGFGQPTTTATQSGFNFGATQTQQPATTGGGFSFGAQPATTTQTTGGLGLGGFNFGGSTTGTTTTGTTGTGFGAFNFGTTPQQPAQQTFQLGLPGAGQQQPAPIQQGIVDINNPYGSGLEAILKSSDFGGESLAQDLTAASLPKKSALSTAAFLTSPKPPARIRPRTMMNFSSRDTVKERLTLYEEDKTPFSAEALVPRLDHKTIHPKYPDQDDSLLSHPFSLGSFNGSKQEDQQKQRDEVAPATPEAPQRKPDQRISTPEAPPQKQPDTEPAQQRAATRAQPQSKLPTLTKVEYYTVPSLDKMRGMSEEQLAQVENFTVGRHNVGEIKFLGKTDVRGLNLDKMVRIVQNSAEVYPEDAYPEEVKPPVGTELNKDAEISLWGIKPKKTTDIATFRKQLEVKAAKYQAEMIDYLPHSGKWIFKVQHFSRYGFDDEDEDESVPQTGPQGQDKKQVPQVQEDKISPQGPIRSYATQQEAMEEEDEAQMSEDILSEEEEEDEDIEHPSFLSSDMEDIIPEQRTALTAVPAVRPSQSFLPKQLGVDARELHSRASLFAEFDEQTRSGQKRPREVSPKVPSPFSLPSTVSPMPPVVRQPQQPLYPFRGVSELITSQQKQMEAVKSAFAEGSVAVQQVQTVERPTSSSIVPPNASITKDFSGKPTDAALFLGRSFRACFSPSGALIIPGFANVYGGARNFMPASPSTVTVKRIQVLEGRTGEAFLHESYTRQLDVSFRNKIDSSSDKIQISKAVHEHVEAAAVAATQSVLVTGQQDKLLQMTAHHHKLAWKLVESLFAIQSKDNIGHLEAMHRKRELIKWLREAVQTQARKEEERLRTSADPNAYLELIYTLLTAFRIADAVEIALDKGDYVLASLIGQAASDSAMDSDLQQQIDNWAASGADQFINPSRLKVYRLLSGDVHDSNSGLDWKRRFGLHLLYGTKSSARVGKAINAFDEHLDEAPLAFYLEQLSALDRSQISSQFKFQEAHYDSLDVCYHLIRLFCDQHYPLYKVLNPLSSSHDPLDSRMPWHLYVILSALGFKPTEQYSDPVHVNFAAQLELAGLWHWAVFVLQHLEVPSDSLEDGMFDDDQHTSNFMSRTVPRQLIQAYQGIKDEAIRSLISRNVSVSEELTREETFLRDALSIPEQIIHAFKAIKASAMQDKKKEIDFLIKAGHFNEAHEKLLAFIAPEAVLCGANSPLPQWISARLQVLASVAPSIAGWESQGKVYYSFLQYRFGTMDIEQEYHLLEELAVRLDNWPYLSDRNPRPKQDQQQHFRERVAVMEMIQQVNAFRIRLTESLQHHSVGLLTTGRNCSSESASSILNSNCLNLLRGVLEQINSIYLYKI